MKEGYNMKIDRPKISPELSLKSFHDIFYEEDPTLEMCEIIDSTFENESVDRVRLYSAVIKIVSSRIQTLAILILQMFVLRTVIYQMLI